MNGANAPRHVEKDNSHVSENAPIQSRHLVEGIVLTSESQLRQDHAAKWHVKVKNFWDIKLLLVGGLKHCDHYLLVSYPFAMLPTFKKMA